MLENFRANVLKIELGKEANTLNNSKSISYLFIYLFIKILDWQFTIVKIEIEKLKFTIDDKYMAYV